MKRIEEREGEKMNPENKQLIAGLKSYLTYLKGLGITELPLSDKQDQILYKPEPSNSTKALGESTSLYQTQHSTIASQTLEEIRKELGDCQRCKLFKTRRSLVFGEGNEKATLMIIGEGPGFDEDLQGRPFVGKAGQLLTKILQSIGFQREEVYITNIIKCRPPQNRNPQPDEIEACYPFLLKQIEAIRPKVICALGTFAAQTLLRTDAKITSLRGKVYRLSGIQVFPTYHPAYLLRNPDKKRDVWEDMKRIAKALTDHQPE